MGHKVVIGGVNYEISSGNAFIDGTSYSISNGRTLVDGTGYDISFVKGVPIGDLAVGTSVFLDVNGKSTEFIIVHQGSPSGIYSASCDGSWLLMKDLYVKEMEYDSGVTGTAKYSTSDMDSYLSNDFYDLIDSGVQSVIKTAKIPYVFGDGEGTSDSAVKSGSNGLSRKVFLLSAIELGEAAYTEPDEDGYVDRRTSVPLDGAKLEYFLEGTETSAKNKRIAKYGSSAYGYWTRSPVIDRGGDKVHGVSSTGTFQYYTSGGSGSTYAYGVRPAFIVNSATLVNQDDYSLLA